MLSGIFSIPFFAITGCIGLVALAMSPDLNPSLAMPFVIKEALPIGVRGLVIAGVISIVMSSADSFLNGAATGFINDIVKPLRKNPLGDVMELRLAKSMNLAVGIASVIFAIKIESVLDILIYAYNFWAPIILVPLAAVLLGCRTSFAGFIAGTLAGAASTLFWNNVMHAPAGVDGLVVGVLCNLLVFSGVTLLTSKR
jgi:SSS family solute:Na+ symporter